MSSFQVQLDDGAVVVGETVGSGLPVLCISGLGGTAAFWKEVKLDSARFQVIRFDQRGIGRSSRGTRPLSIELLAEDCVQVMDALKIPSVHCVGHSTGGCIAQALELSHSERVQSLVLGGSWAGPNTYMQALFAFRSRLLRCDAALYEQQGVYLSYPAEYLWEHERLQRVGVGQWTDQRKQIVQERIDALLRFDARDRLSGLSVPSLILSAADDAVVPATLQEELRQLIPEAEFTQWGVGGHFFPLTLSSVYSDRLTAWLNGCSNQ